MPNLIARTAFLGTVLATLCSGAVAQDGGGSSKAADLAAQSANPVSDLTSVPFQFNYDTGIGPEDADRLIVNVQPVTPFSLNDNWNLIVRTIVPFVYQDNAFPGQGEQSGIGDTVQTFFLSPKAAGPGGMTWGVGPVFLWPTATDRDIGGEKWGAGLSAVVLKQQGPWTFGGLTNHIWSYAGDDDRNDISSTFLQPFVNYTWANGTSFFLNTESTYDWEAEQWSVPINTGFNKVLNLGGNMVQVGAGVRYWAEAPENGPEGWGARVNVNFLFPK
ncbi:transporter [Qingshengfaniella alkalisoli]|uniref:Transporter n=1 Tax=Qingshengfaniella alkalisoli TaxID=2599296 RepID=A0A5B8I5I6_9RHOB|nr:transporter [Qingshengfaniella alkalisoli]QDY68555.1 transporter [Qingshengfaniella alkalisoli]